MHEVIRIDGFDEMKQALADSPQTTLPYLKRAMSRALLIVHGTVRQYPSESEANRPKDRLWWYQRGFGVRWKLANGSIRGKKTSEQLGKQWNSQVKVHMQGISGMKGPVVEGTEGNAVRYAKWVQSKDQRSYHGMRGWITIEDAVARSSSGIYDEFADAVDAWINQEWVE